MVTKRRTKKLKPGEMQPQPHEVNVHRAQEMLGYKHPASVRKLLEGDVVKARKIGHDLWFDSRTIEQYLAERKLPGRPRTEESAKSGGRKRKSADEAEREYQRKYKRDYRAGVRRRPSKKGARAARGKK